MAAIAIVEVVSAVYLGVQYFTQMGDSSSSKSRRLLNVCTLLVLFTLLVDAMAYIFMDDSTPFAFRYVVCLLAYLGEGICFLGFSYYSESYFAGKAELNPWVFRVLRIAEVIWIMATAVTFISGKMVIFRNGVEVADNGYPLYLSVYQIIVMLYTPVVALHFRKELGNEAVFLLSLFNIAPIIGILWAIVAYYDCSYFIGAIALVFISEFLEKKNVQQQLKENRKNQKEAENK